MLVLDFYIDLVEKYPITSIEDPFEEEDFHTFAMLTDEVEKSDGSWRGPFSYKSKKNRTSNKITIV